MIVLELPAGIFQSGDYILSLAQAGASNNNAASATYAFRVKAAH
jgi:hypothetical protein